MDYSKKQKQKYKELNRRLMQYVAMVNQIYQSYNEEASRIAMTTGYNSDSEGDFKFSDYPKTKYSIEKLQRNFADNMQALIYSGISKEWKNSNDAQDLLANEILKKYKGQVNGEKQKIIYQTNSDAMKAFANRTDKGLDLSDKVWKQSDEYVRALEAAISTAISKGTSAVTLSKQISKYLIDFDKLQKDYKSQFGQATDIHDCEYRSARLARSEINMAYRTAEQTRWNEMDFVRGYRIELSNNHSDRRKKHGEYSDICDELQGDYPKDFKWTGWHPNCRCHAVPLLMSEEDFIRWNNGESVDKNLIKDVPENYKRWAAENADKIEQAGARGTQPYFVRDNERYMPEAKNNTNLKEYAYRSTNQRDKNNVNIVNTKDNVKTLSATNNIKDKVDFADYLIHNDFTIDDYSISKIDSTLKTLDIIKYDKAITNELNKFGVTFTDKKIYIGQDTSYINYQFKAGQEIGSIRRNFINEDGKLVVYNELLTIPKSLQQKGIAKRLFKELDSIYKDAGVDIMRVHANINLGGRTWAKFGFWTTKQNAISIVTEKKLTGEISIEEHTLLKKQIETESKGNNFNMSLLKDYIIGKNKDGSNKYLLDGSDWYGWIELKDKNSTLYYYDYLFNR